MTMIYQASKSRDRLPTNLFQAWADLWCRISLTIIGYEIIGSEALIAELQHLTNEFDISDRVSSLSHLARPDILEAHNAADIDIAITESATQDYKLQPLAGASNKALENKACDDPLLVPDTSD